MDGFDSDSKMKAMKAIMDYADEADDQNLLASSGRAKPLDSSGANEGFLDESQTMNKSGGGAGDAEDEPKKKKGGMGGMMGGMGGGSGGGSGGGGMDMSALMSMFGGG